MNRNLEPKPPLKSQKEVPNIHFDNKKLIFIKSNVKYEFTFENENKLHILAKSLQHYVQWEADIVENDDETFTPSLVYKVFSDLVTSGVNDRVQITFPKRCDPVNEVHKILIDIENEYTELSMTFPIKLQLVEPTMENRVNIALEYKDMQISNLFEKYKKLQERVAKLERKTHEYMNW